MAKRTPRIKDNNSNIPVTYTRTIRIPSITINKEDFNSLISILEKTGQTPTFGIEAGQESLTFTNIQSLGSENWPANIKQLRFRSGYPLPQISGYIDNPDQFNYSKITLEANNRDWISARADELTRFFSQHRNLHYIFHNPKYTLVQGILLAGLLIYLSITHFSQSHQDAFRMISVFASVYSVLALYAIFLPKSFPFLILEPEHPTTYTRLRHALKFLIPAIFVGLIVQAILISLS